MKLIGNVKSIINDEFIAKCTEMAKQFNPGTRELSEVISHTIGGEAVEILVCKYFNLTQSDFGIMEYDAYDKHGRQYEIKHTVINSKWWNYNPSNYKFFLDNAYKLDYIVLCYYDKNTGDVYLKFRADAKSFADYSSYSKYNNNCYYNNKKAVAADACIEY